MGALSSLDVDLGCHMEFFVKKKWYVRKVGSVMLRL